VNRILKPTKDQIKILKTIHDARKATAAELAQKLGEPYTVQDLTLYLKLLEKESLLSKVQENPLTYQLSNLGLIVIGALPEKAKNIFSSVPQNKCFLFYTGLGSDHCTNISACNLVEFRDKIGVVDVKSLEFHIPRGDIEKWARDVLGDDELAKKIERIKGLKLKGEQLRSRVLGVVDSRIKELTSAS
jgi:hypothetical protein